MKKITTKLITEGAIYIAVYALLAILTRYLITGTDSMIYYIYPLPMAIYSLKNGFKISLLVFTASVALSFLFGLPLYVIGLMLPNIIIGFVTGILLKYCKNSLVNFSIIFALMFIADYLSIEFYSIINGISYFDSTKDIIVTMFKWFNISDEELIKKIFNIALYALLIIDSIVKLVLNILLINLIVIRLNLFKDYKPKFKIPLRYNPLIGLGYLLVFGLFMFSLYNAFFSDEYFIQIIVILLYALVFIYSFYLMYQAIFFIKIRSKNTNLVGSILISILIVILFPISILLGFILNIINYNFIADSMKH